MKLLTWLLSWRLVRIHKVDSHTTIKCWCGQLEWAHTDTHAYGSEDLRGWAEISSDIPYRYDIQIPTKAPSSRVTAKTPVPNAPPKRSVSIMKCLRHNYPDYKTCPQCEDEAK